MQYRPFGKLGVQVSALGFGAMRLPTLGDPSQIDEPEAIRMIRHAIDSGVNYVDTAYPYHGGNSERVVGKALQDGYRQKTNLATKLPVRLVEAHADFDRLLNEQLAKLQTDHVDFYLLHGLNQKSWEFVRDLGVTRWAEGALRDGRIRHLGFSFHDNHEAFRSIVDGYDGWEFCQVQYNYMDEDLQAGTKGVQYAAAKGLGVVVMEPLLGGQLASPPPAIQQIFGRAQRKRSAAEWGLQWVWNHPEVSVVLSGMTTMDQLVENLSSAGRSAIGSLTADELRLVAMAHDKFDELYPIPCTQCRYCMPCPNGVDIPTNTLTFNRGIAMDQLEVARFRYAAFLNKPASACIQCRECEEKCPQGIPIGDWMPYVDEVLGQKANYDPALAPISR